MTGVGLNVNQSNNFLANIEKDKRFLEVNLFPSEFSTGSAILMLAGGDFLIERASMA